jgi:predicted GNAT family acetyltransferase
MAAMDPQTGATDGGVFDNEAQRRFEIDLGDGRLAIAEYNRPAGMIMFTHTEVPPEHGGKGIGTRLIKASLASARERGLKVIPICPFFAAFMQSHADTHDLLDSSWKTRLGLR